MKLFLAGDVMLGRGIDQIMPHSNDPVLFEDYVTSAERYVDLAEDVNGAIPRPVPFEYVWGDGLDELARQRPDIRFINLETAVTTSPAAEPKGINYRMHPGNIQVLGAARIDACSLSNNHVMDWGRDGLIETLETLEATGVGYVGAGRDRARASAPWLRTVPGKGRVIFLGLGSVTSGIPAVWEASADQPGVNLIRNTDHTIASVRRIVDPIRQPGDLVVVSIHWGGNWGYSLPSADHRLAHRLIDDAGVDVVHGHSSHHPKAIEVYRGKPILYGCGDLINDYEGIGGRDSYRSELVLMYFIEIGGPDGALRALNMAPFEIRRFRLQRATPDQTAWLIARMDRECAAFGGKVRPSDDGTLSLS